MRIVLFTWMKCELITYARAWINLHMSWLIAVGMYISLVYMYIKAYAVWEYTLSYSCFHETSEQRRQLVGHWHQVPRERYICRYICIYICIMWMYTEERKRSVDERAKLFVACERKCFLPIASNESSSRDGGNEIWEMLRVQNTGMRKKGNICISG